MTLTQKDKQFLQVMRIDVQEFETQPDPAESASDIIRREIAQDGEPEPSKEEWMAAYDDSERKNDELFAQNLAQREALYRWIRRYDSQRAALFVAGVVICGLIGAPAVRR